MRHPASVEGLGFLQLQSQIEETQRGKDTQAKCYSPGSSEVALREYQNEEHGHDGRNDETKINLDVTGAPLDASPD
jgi:hypothetical protein